jgi:hypothetical protein
LKVNRRFGATYLLHLQVRRISQARKQREAGGKYSDFVTKASPPSLLSSYDCYLLLSDFLLGLFLDPAVGDEMFFRNVGLFSTDYTVLCS